MGSRVRLLVTPSMYTKRTITFSALLLLLGTATIAQASIFPDVPDGHIFQESVESLVPHVINGNPDGTYKPKNPVNRAAMLKMLYKAQGKVPDPLNIRCFPDVEIGSWYEPFVCDAASRRYVDGYANGTFLPANPVNRVEALKMITTVFDIPVEDITDADRDLVKFVDVSTSAWYTKYLFTAYAKGILPIPGQSGSHFYPDWELTRGEAAAYIFNALNVDLTETRKKIDEEASSSSSSEEEESSSSTSTTGDTSSSAQSEDDGVDSSTVNVGLPFTHEGKFDKKISTSYLFDISSSKTVKITASLQSSQPGQVSCRLYLLPESGFSDEYFLGYQEGDRCYIHAALNPGSYQLQLQPTQKDVTYSVEAEEAVGDGNDGFREAKTLTVNGAKNDVLVGHDYEDWFTFSVVSEQRMAVSVQIPTELRCIVYAMSDVNLESFTGPQCNQTYAYPPGTYYVSVGRKAPRGSAQSFTIELEK